MNLSPILNFLVPSLFNILLRLQNRHIDKTPLEDFFTEIFAYLIQDAPDVLGAFVFRFKLTQLQLPVMASVSTQVSYDRLETHDMDSRPDIVVRIESEGRHGLVFIESKIASKEGYKQLQRYAEHLAEQPQLEERTLVYVTRDYDPKDASKILTKQASTGIRFIQLRWYDVYSFLKKSFSQHWLALEVCRFMETNHMAQNLQFSPIDLLALTNFRQAKSMMDQSLDGEVLVRLQKFGGSGLKLTSAIKQFDWHGRYIIFADQRNGLWVGIGYFMPDDDAFTYPRVGLTMEVNTRAPGDAKVVVEAMQAIMREKPIEWTGDNVTVTNHWVSIHRVKPLHDFLSGEDHQHQVKSYFLDCLKELEEIRTRYPQLPWTKEVVPGNIPPIS